MKEECDPRTFRVFCLYFPGTGPAPFFLYGHGDRLSMSRLFCQGAELGGNLWALTPAVRMEKGLSFVGAFWYTEKDRNARKAFRREFMKDLFL